MLLNLFIFKKKMDKNQLTKWTLSIYGHNVQFLIAELMNSLFCNVNQNFWKPEQHFGTSDF